MAAPKRDKLMLARDRERVCELLMRGYRVPQIHRMINEGRPDNLQITREAIYNDIKVMEKEWIESGVQNFNAWRMRMVEEYKDIKTVLWEEFEKSKRNKVKMETENVVDQEEYEEALEEGRGLRDDGQVFHRKGKIIEEIREGNPAYIQQIIAVEDKIAELLGLKGANKIAFTDPSGQFEANPGEYVMAILEQMTTNKETSPLPEQKQLGDGEVIDAEEIEDDDD